MAIDSVGFIAPSTELEVLLGNTSAQKTQFDFSTWLNQEVSAINQQIQNAELQVQNLAIGEQDNLHQVMTSLEKAKLSFELGIQVRNKLLEGYQEIMRMQV